MKTNNLEAFRKWKQIPPDIQQKILNNVFCSKCFVTTIVDYSMDIKDGLVVIEGKCKSCGKDVARVLD